MADHPRKLRPTMQAIRVKLVAIDRALFYFDGDLYEFERIESGA